MKVTTAVPIGSAAAYSRFVHHQQTSRPDGTRTSYGSAIVALHAEPGAFDGLGKRSREILPILHDALRGDVGTEKSLPVIKTVEVIDASDLAEYAIVAFFANRQLCISVDLPRMRESDRIMKWWWRKLHPKEAATKLRQEFQQKLESRVRQRRKVVRRSA